MNVITLNDRQTAELEANHCGCMGSQRWNLDGSARANEATSDLMTSMSTKNG